MTINSILNLYLLRKEGATTVIIDKITYYHGIIYK